MSTGTNFQVLQDADNFLSVERLSASQEDLFSVELIEAQKCGSTEMRVFVIVQVKAA